MEVNQIDGPHGTVALFGDNQLGEAAEIFAFAMINFFAENEADDVCVLLDRPRLAKIAQLRAVIALAGFDRAA